MKLGKRKRPESVRRRVLHPNLEQRQCRRWKRATEPEQSIPNPEVTVVDSTYLASSSHSSHRYLKGTERREWFNSQSNKIKS